MERFQQEQGSDKAQNVSELKRKLKEAYELEEMF